MDCTVSLSVHTSVHISAYAHSCCVLSYHSLSLSQDHTYTMTGCRYWNKNSYLTLFIHQAANVIEKPPPETCKSFWRSIPDIWHCPQNVTKWPLLCDYQNEDGKVYRVHNTPSCWPHWLTDSRRLNHKVVARPASSLAQDRESSPVETSILTTMLRRHGPPSYACSNRLT